MVSTKESTRKPKEQQANSFKYQRALTFAASTSWLRHCAGEGAATDSGMTLNPACLRKGERLGLQGRALDLFQGPGGVVTTQRAFLAA